MTLYKFSVLIQLAEGKLNSLEEFRQAKEELMRKFQEQEEKFQQQEKRHDDQLYEVEKQYMLDRDRLQKELEKRLLQLSADFQTTFQLRIASHTQRVIRENVAVNNELGTLMTSWKHIMDENLALKQDNTKLRLELSHVTATRDEIHRSNLRKQQLMLDLKENYMKMKQSYAQITAYENQNAALSEQVNHWKAKHNQAYSQLTKLSL
ncbi:cilia- and flagella-associated protein 157-like [Diaphorina citri]|uniref:Cilia- and flagella-associated protein 157 n=1 Tax=Diaphorina citri TaxID=121845 RepID=A0A3Q0ISJ0_DIACI|nr:cilia- and flagella-associated protein 157-like [Diaphorina citri]